MSTSVSDLVDPAIASIANTLVNGLTQVEQNGGGVWGTLQAPQLPKWVGGPNAADAAGQQTPWDPISTTNTDPYTSPPNTGVTRNYDFTVSDCTIAPDGVQLPNEICINGQFPGPMIEADYGDWIQVTVHNDLSNANGGTSLHWHGLLQKETPWFDGIPSIGQCPIAPGQTYTYNFRADLYGTTWYHSHYSTQYAGGAYGPLVIYGPDDTDNVTDLGPVMLADWYHNDYRYLVGQTMAPDDVVSTGGPNAPTSNNNLINGKMNYDCSQTSLPCTPNAGLSKFSFHSGQTFKLRLINSGAQAIQKFSIDNHSLTVIANDFVPVQPYQTDHVSLGVGQRADILVNATGASTDAVWMRSNVKGCSIDDGISPLALAAIYYEDADTTVKPTTTSSVNDTSQSYCANDALETTIPKYVIPVSDPGTTEEIEIALQSNGTHMLYYMNNVTFRADYNNPTLLQVHNNNLTFAPETAVHNYGTNGTVRLVVSNTDTQPHPMHLHGHNMQILNVGFGPWDGTVVRSDNPQRRDSQLLPPGSVDSPSHMVVQWTADNPGVWPFHCHIAWHLSAGLYFTVLENPGSVASDGMFSGLGDVVGRTCDSWGSFSGANVVWQIDDGV